MEIIAAVIGLGGLLVLLVFAAVHRSREGKRPAAEGEAACHYCGGVLEVRERWSTGAILTFLVGLLLAPVCVGVVLLVVPFFMGKVQTVVCRKCGAPA